MFTIFMRQIYPCSGYYIQSKMDLSIVLVGSQYYLIFPKNAESALVTIFV